MRTVLAVLAIVGLLTGCTAGVAGRGTHPYRSTLALGLVGPYTDDALTRGAAAGVSAGLVEMTWREAEPDPGRFDTAYLGRVGAQVRDLRARGLRVALNTGVQDAPAWLLQRPGARFVDQDGTVYTGQNVPNLVFGTGLRATAQRYLDRVLAALPAVDLVRVGGGVQGELSYPYVFGADGRVQNRYWAYDANARATDPVPGWRPGDPSPHGEAGRFLTWYLDALVDYQNWQIRALRAAGHRGPVAVLYPSSGIRPGDVDAAVADDLRGATSPEINGEIQRGYDVARQVAALTDPGAVVYGTWGENTEVVAFLAGLARAAGRPVMAENAGPDTRDQLAAALHNAAAQGLSAFWLVRASDLTCGCGGHATLADAAAIYRELPAAS